MPEEQDLPSLDAMLIHELMSPDMTSLFQETVPANPELTRPQVPTPPKNGVPEMTDASQADASLRDGNGWVVKDMKVILIVLVLLWLLVVVMVEAVVVVVLLLHVLLFLLLV